MKNGRNRKTKEKTGNVRKQKEIYNKNKRSITD